MDNRRRGERKLSKQAAKESDIDRLFSSQSLKNAPVFNPNLTLGKTCTEVAYEILEKVWKGKKKREPHWSNKKIEAIIIFANLLSRKRNVPIAISLDPNKKDAKGKERDVNRPRIDLIKILIDQGYIEREKGYYDPNSGKGESARIAPTCKCLNMFKKAELLDEILDNDQAIVLKEICRNKKEHTPQRIRFKKTDAVFEGTSDVKSLIEFHASMKKMYERHKVEIPYYKRGKVASHTKLNTDFHFKFTGSFDKGGRLHVCGGTASNNYQMFKTRSDIIIDGEKTIELDFSGTHVMMLYAEKGIQYDKDKDVYTICPESSDLRPIFKTILLTLLNAKSYQLACKACNKEINLDGYTTLRPIREKHKLTIDDAIRMVEKHHKDIKDKFYRTPCHRLMNREARIAVDVLDYFMKRDIPVLSVHESFIIQEKYRRQLERVMERAYKKRIGFECRVSKK